MNALSYEHLLRKIYDCERGGVNGKADADYYRKMEHAINAVKVQKNALDKGEMPIYNQSLDDLQYETRVATAHVRGALLDALRVLYRTASESDGKKLQDLMKNLHPDQYDVNNINTIIDRAYDIAKDY